MKGQRLDVKLAQEINKLANQIETEWDKHGHSEEFEGLVHVIASKIDIFKAKLEAFSENY